jgi:mannose-6-phosphate isomerase-like protein (cupin superfamily)
MTTKPDVNVAVRASRASLRRLADQDEFRSVCGMRRDLVGPAEDEPLLFHYMRIHDSTKHYHRKTIEYYYVVEGAGEMELDGETIAIAKGDMIVVPTGVWHTSRPTTDAELHILICALPQGVEASEQDTHYE